jgi:hypothetical protein
VRDGTLPLAEKASRILELGQQLAAIENRTAPIGSTDNPLEDPTLVVPDGAGPSDIDDAFEPGAGETTPPPRVDTFVDGLAGPDGAGPRDIDDAFEPGAGPTTAKPPDIDSVRDFPIGHSPTPEGSGDGSKPPDIDSVRDFPIDHSPPPAQVQPDDEDDGGEIAYAAPRRPGVPVGVLGLGAVLLAGGALFAGVLMRGGSPAAPTSTAPAAASPAAASPAAVSPGAGVPLPCTASPVTDAALEAIPRNQRMYVSVYCLGGHFYPTEQFKLNPDFCRVGNNMEGYYVTSSGGPARAIDDPNVTLPNPNPNGCGYFLMKDVGAVSGARLMPPSANPSGMYPIRTDAYNAWKAQQGAGPAR